MQTQLLRILGQKNFIGFNLIYTKSYTGKTVIFLTAQINFDTDWAVTLGGKQNTLFKWKM